MPHTVTLIPGDGVGPELAAAARHVIDASGAKIVWEVQDAGFAVMEKEGTPLPDRVLDSIRRNKVALKGPITTPRGGGFRSVNVALRKALDLYACLRPCKHYPGVRTRFENVDLVVVRENTEDLYAGVEFEPGTPEAKQVIALAGGRIRDDAAISIKPISAFGSERIVDFAFRYAVENGRRKVTAVAKDNIMKATDGLFYRAAREVAKRYEGKAARALPAVAVAGGDLAIEYDEWLVDAMCMQLVQKPELYDVLVMPNLYGDILSDLCAGLVGGLGVAPGANIGEEVAVFEAIHGSAPKYTGMNKVNPTALILSGVLMLRHLGEKDAADRVERAVASVIAEGKHVTYDMKPDRTDPSAVGTREMAEAVVGRMGS